MPSLEARLIAGLEAQDWRETASRGPYRRWGKFGRGAMYIFREDQHKQHAVWFSELHRMQPEYPVVGPILQQLLAAGDKQLAQARLDSEALLIELLDAGDKPNGGSR